MDNVMHHSLTHKDNNTIRLLGNNNLNSIDYYPINSNFEKELECYNNLGIQKLAVTPIDTMNLDKIF